MFSKNFIFCNTILCIERQLFDKILQSLGKTTCSLVCEPQYLSLPEVQLLLILLGNSFFPLRNTVPGNKKYIVWNIQCLFSIKDPDSCSAKILLLLGKATFFSIYASSVTFAFGSLVSINSPRKFILLLLLLGSTMAENEKILSRILMSIF